MIHPIFQPLIGALEKGITGQPDGIMLNGRAYVAVDAIGKTPVEEMTFVRIEAVPRGDSNG